MPIQKEGMAMPNTEMVLPMTSIGLLRFMADRMPSGTATMTESSIERSVSSMVTGRRCMRMLLTGCCDTNEWPKSPVTKPPNQSR